MAAKMDMCAGVGRHGWLGGPFVSGWTMAKLAASRAGVLIRMTVLLRLSPAGLRASIPEKLGAPFVPPAGAPAARKSRALSQWAITAKVLKGKFFPIAVNKADSLAQAESRLGRLLTCARCVTATWQFVPLMYLDRSRVPWLVLLAAVTAAAEACWVLRRAWGRGTLRDPLMVGVDVACCLWLIVAELVAMGPAGLSHLPAEVLPFLLVGAGLAGAGLVRPWPGLVAFAAIAMTWAAATVPVGGLQVVPDLVGLGLCYLLATQFGELRQLAETAVQDQRTAGEQIRVADLARERELAYREIHGRSSTRWPTGRGPPGRGPRWRPGKQPGPAA